ncbi:TlpA disulfide reductase family protein [Citricoccus sp. I39-566]|uniref:TlpA family protein disulfide reductase n=1 Tax=Citricoccus sp. I39-566 TaxID=3073268 RepID=UPI00286C840C|nr:TlpA disulfide reductase family protein [Citricoccus sp. I39-566]WMY79977.1 TlpA disulfide reductase family protein [Citricoccus sp. I39-566]
MSYTQRSHYPHSPTLDFPGQLGRRRVLAGLAGAVSLPLLAACSSDDTLAAQAGNSDGKNYIAGDGSVLEITPTERGQPVQFSSTLLSGEPISTQDLVGDPAVLNFWYAACAPCRVEAPDLQSLHEQFDPAGVRFLGINVRDTVATARAFERTFGITYPSVEDRGGQVLLAMTDYVPPQAVPTTIVLDRAGRVAGRILGIADPSTLRSLITTVLDEQA